ncbi:MAG: DUF2314 domain-containing protein [Solirubrobacterales bacterium]|nr:DUF2314 domain-containing protein [Solirubrobacterales bacterium]
MSEARDPGEPELARCSICGGEHPVATMVTAHEQPEEGPPEASPGPPDPSDWWLQDGAAMQREHPRSFFVPPASRSQALRAGELVRLGFEFGPHADRASEGHIERMWVEVVEQDGDGHARGRLRNSPSRLTELRFGDLVAFEPRHVLSIEYSDEELGYAQDQWPIVDAAVMRDDRPPDIVVRAAGPYAADEEEWWMICKHDAAGPTSESAGLLTDRFPGLDEPLRSGSGLWELADGERGDARWRRVGDDEIEESEDWQAFLAWLSESAQLMRDAEPAPEEEG